MSTEDALPYDGPLSTYTEWDAFLYGLVVGYTRTKPPMNDP